MTEKKLNLEVINRDSNFSQSKRETDITENYQPIEVSNNIIAKPKKSEKRPKEKEIEFHKDSIMKYNWKTQGLKV